MKSVCAVAGAVVFACQIAGVAETKVPCSENVSDKLQSRALLTIDSRPAGIHIVGTDQETIHVSCTSTSHETARDVTVHFSRTPDGGKLSIAGTHLHGGDNNLEVTVEVPRRTSLRVRLFAGEVDVKEIKGDKDIEIGAGQITISSIHEGDYRSVDASVSVGEVQARAFGSDKGGFFRKFTKKNATGDYRLRAHVTTGEIDLLGNAERNGNDAKSD